MNQDIADRISELVLARDLGTITMEQNQELEELLLSSAAARLLYLQLCADTASLHAQAHEDLDTMLVPGIGGDGGRAAPRRRRLVIWAAVAGWAAAVFLVIWGATLRSPGGGRPGREMEDPAVAVLAAAPGARWHGERLLPVGRRVAPETVVLDEGLAHFEFYSGASVVLEGPAVLTLQTPLLATLHSGRLRCQVPVQAHGFTVAVPGASIVDLGTAFGVEVSEAGSLVHVFEGTIEIVGKLTERLQAGQSATVGADGSIAHLPSVAEGAFFKGPADLVDLVRVDDDRQLQAWRSYSEELRSSPDLLLYFTFEGQAEWERTVANQAPRPDVPAGALVGAHWSEGRWPGKKALELKQISDRIHITIPGQYEALTMAAWVRFDSFDNWLSSLLLTDSWANGNPHWHVTWEGETILGIGTKGTAKYINYYSEKQAISTMDIGRWMHLACVYDPTEHVVRQYLDGREIARETIPVAKVLTFGQAAIGNWSSLEKSRRDIRQVNGRIDEFAIWSRALSPGEIAAMAAGGVR